MNRGDGINRMLGEPENVSSLQTRRALYGAALFNNDGHNGQTKTKARSKVASAMIADANGKRGADWAEYSEFIPTESFVKELEQFEKHAKSQLWPQYEHKQFQDIGGSVLKTVRTMYDETGSVLMITLPLKSIWPTMDADIQKLYLLAVDNLPKHNRSKHPTRQEWMHSLGIKQMGMGDNSQSIMLKMKAHPTHDAFIKAAAKFYCKQNILERLVAPDNSKTRLSMRDELQPNSACAIPGLEDKLWALACSITKDYYPELHHDCPLGGTLECILFSSSDGAVFAAQYGQQAEIVQLDEPVLIVLDSKRVKHASQKNAATAKSAFGNTV